MLGKLLKYDLRSMLKQFAFIWPAALVMALINRFTLGLLDSGDTFPELVSGMSMLIYVAVIIALCVLVFVFIIERFFKGLLGDEGYLMFTLPVESWQLILSKLLCALITALISVLVAIVSVSIILGYWWLDFSNMVEDFGRSYVVFFWEFMVLILLAVIYACLMLYLAMAIGHLFSKYRIVASAVAFLVLNSAMNLATTLIGSVVANGVHLSIGLSMNFATWHVFLGVMICCILFASVIFFLITNYILKHRLNLE